MDVVAVADAEAVVAALVVVDQAPHQAHHRQDPLLHLVEAERWVRE